MPLSPAFAAQRTAQVTNVTGDGTAYTIVYDVEIFDRGGDFDGTSTFTAPVTGLYEFVANVYFQSLTSSFTTVALDIVTSNRT